MGERVVKVHTYVRRDGTAVRAHDRNLGGAMGAAGSSDASLRDGLNELAGERPYREVLGKRIPLAGTGEQDEESVVFHSIPEGTDLSGLDLRSASFTGQTITGVNFQGADLRGASFFASRLYSLDLRGARTQGINFENSQAFGLIADELDFYGVTATGSILRFDPIPGPDGEERYPTIWNLDQAHLGSNLLVGFDVSGQQLNFPQKRTTVDFEKGNFDDADLRGSSLKRYAFRECWLREANLTGVAAENSIWKGVNGRGLVATGGNFTGAAFIESDMSGSDFTHTQLGVREITNSKFDDVNFTGTSFEYSFTGTSFEYSFPPAVEGSSLRGANFTDADLADTNFAPFNPTNMFDDGAEWPSTDLSDATWTGAKTANMVVRQVLSGEALTVHGDASDRTVRQLAEYERFTLDDAADLLNVDRDTLAVLVWGGEVEMRNNYTGDVITSGDTADGHIPVWAIQNYR
jgi:uncharacterized protein YjbI with pentapeptide repeats